MAGETWQSCTWTALPAHYLKKQESGSPSQITFPVPAEVHYFLLFFSFFFFLFPSTEKGWMGWIPTATKRGHNTQIFGKSNWQWLHSWGVGTAAHCLWLLSYRSITGPKGWSQPRVPGAARKILTFRPVWIFELWSIGKWLNAVFSKWMRV